MDGIFVGDGKAAHVIILIHI